MPYDMRCRRELACHPDLALGERSYFRPGQLLLNEAAARRYRQELTRLGGKPDARYARETARHGLDLRRWVLPRETDVLGLVKWMRRDAARDKKQRIVVGPNYAWRGEPRYSGGPGGKPRPVVPVDDMSGHQITSESDGVDLAVLDTGVVPDDPRNKLYPALRAMLRPDPTDVETLDVDGNGVLDTQNGHGIFVAGVAHRVAPSLVMDPGLVLDSFGVGDDATVTLELLETQAPVINLSLGGYTEDDRAPVAMAEAVRVLLRDKVVVAAAGNNASDRPFWPAAFKGVLAVAAYGRYRRADVPSKFSNYGHWVDVCALGEGIVSAFAHYPVDHDGKSPGFTGFASWNGTSFAAPQVAAMLAEQLKYGKASSGRDAVAWLLDTQCHHDPNLADYGLKLPPPVDLTV
jgi:hypothetical protein